MKFTPLSLTLAAALLGASALSAQIYWQGGGTTTAYTDGTNWEGATAPTSGAVVIGKSSLDAAVLGAAPTLGGGDLSALNGQTISLFNDAAITSLGLRLDGNTLTFNDSSSLTAGGGTALGRDGGSGSTTINFDSSGAFSVTTGTLIVGRKEDGFFNQSSGTVNAPNGLVFGAGSNSGAGTFTLSGGTVNAETVSVANANAHSFVFTAGSTGLLSVNNGGSAFDFATLIGDGFFLKDAGDSWDIGDNTLAVIAVPEPSAFGLGLGLGLLALGSMFVRRRR